MPALGGDKVTATAVLKTKPVTDHLARIDTAVLTSRAGDVRGALSVLTPMAGLRRRGLAPLGRARLISALLDAHLSRGDLGDAMALGDDLSPLLAKSRVAAAPLAAAVAHHAKGTLVAALGDPASAVEHFEAVESDLAAAAEHGELLSGAPTEDVRAWRNGAALAMLRTGRAREAQVLSRQEVDRVEQTSSTYAVALALRTLAATDTGIERVAILRRARAAAHEARAARLAQQVSADLAGLLVLDVAPGARGEALVLLREAEEYAGHQELWPLQSRVRRLLDHLGEQPHRVRDEALSVLSVSERRVATLAAEGMMNRDIALHVQLSVKAVEWHLSKVYRKLGITSRSRLAATLGV